MSGNCYYCGCDPDEIERLRNHLVKIESVIRDADRDPFERVMAIKAIFNETVKTDDEL